jgi:Regulator of Chromosome Condensation (RCC1) repeat protein
MSNTQAISRSKISRVVLAAAAVVIVGGCEKPSSPLPERSAVVLDTFHHNFACRVRAGTIECRGENAWGVFGHSRLGVFQHEFRRVTDLEQVRSIAVGLTHLCAILGRGKVKCWGHDDEGQIGDGPSEPDHMRFNPSPRTVEGISDAIAVSAGDFHSCVLKVDRTIRCWGAASGTAAEGSSIQPPIRVAVPEATQLVGNLQQTCVLTVAHEVYCWGGSVPGADGAIEVALGPLSVPAARGADLIEARYLGMCAWKNGDRLACWWSNGDERPFSFMRDFGIWPAD